MNRSTDATRGATSTKIVSPSRIARYYFQECARYLRYSSTLRKHWEEEGIPPAPYDFRPVSTAILETGYAWEEEVVEQYLAGDVWMAEPDDEPTLVRDRIMTVDDTLGLLRRLEPGEWMYQGTLVTPPPFYERYGIDPSVVQIADCRPDLIECFRDEDGGLRLRVTDVKASTGVKLSHRIQSTMYSLILEHVLATAGITDRIVDGMGGVWLSQAPEPETFDIRAMRPPLEAFLEDELQPMMARPADETEWHLYFRCEWCPYFEHCREEMRRTNDVSRVPYLTSHAKRFLHRLEPPVRTVKDLEKLVADPAATETLANCASLRGRTDRLRLQTKALRTGKLLATGGSSIAMPRGEHVQLILTLQDEPVSGQVYAYGIYAHGLKPVLGENPPIAIGVAPAGDPETIQDLERAFVRDLYDLLANVHDFNAEHDEWIEQRSLQVYVFDSYEVKLLTDVLLRRILDPEVEQEALQLFMHFQQPELIQAEDHPADEVFFPAVVLVNVLRTVFALPIEVTYRFRDVAELFRADGGFEYRPSDYMAFELSNQVRSDAIYAVWTKGKPYIDRIEKESRARLWATRDTIFGIRAALGKQGSPLFAWPPRFFLPETLSYRQTVLSRLAFLARYESVLGYLGTRSARMAPLEEQLRSGATLRLTYRGDDRFELDRRHEDLDISANDGFLSWIFVDDSDEGLRARLQYNDYAHKSKVWVPKKIRLALAGITGVESTPERPNVALHLSAQASSEMPELSKGGTYLLCPRETDFNTDHVIRALRDEDDRDDPPFVQLLEAPGAFARKLRVPPGARDTALDIARRHGMTPSQLATFEGVLDRRLQLVWGPPGTGKTHFLALAILCLAEAHRTAGLPLRVLVTAFTHAAIDNCLRKVAQLDRELVVVGDDLPIQKLKETKLTDMDGVEAVPEKGWDWPSPVAVVGGTVWAIRKGDDDAMADLVVVDEGSQLEVPESVLAVQRLTQSGRLLIAGDDRQLPPIVQGTYPDPAEDEPLLHRSIFECLRTQDPDAAFTSTLLENFRMNETLCRYPAVQIYVPEYRSATEDIGARCLALTDGRVADPLVEALIDPAYPLVVGVLDGVQATAENVVEADLVARAAVELRRRLSAGNGETYPRGRAGDAAFWKHGLFIVSPHHAQINAVRRALRERRDWSSEPFVDTVDKMQGQECDAVIATYGVSDVEYAMGEKEFIYSLNRLNVSITRARAKTIVFLPRPLTEPPIGAFEDDRIAEGIAFMQGLVRFAEHEGQTATFRLDGEASLQLHRIHSGDRRSP